jgi:thiamine kinase-like enzyme
MEYVRGVSFFEYIQKHSIELAKAKFQSILDYISESNEINENISLDITKKIDSLKLHSRYDIYKKYCSDFDWGQINKSYCHGDLTFENIIISNDEIYFIDFLDSFTDTKLIDYSKIFQELYAFWSFRNKDKKFNIKYVILDKMVNLSPTDRDATLRLLVLSLLRILPYSGQEDCQFLEEQMKYISESESE